MTRVFVAAGHAGTVNGLAWSPDGTRLAHVRLHGFGRSLIAYTTGGAHCGDPAVADVIRVQVGDAESVPARQVDARLYHSALLADFFAGRPVPP